MGSDGQKATADVSARNDLSDNCSDSQSWTLYGNTVVISKRCYYFVYFGSLSDYGCPSLALRTQQLYAPCTDAQALQKAMTDEQRETAARSGSTHQLHEIDFVFFCHDYSTCMPRRQVMAIPSACHAAEPDLATFYRAASAHRCVNAVFDELSRIQARIPIVVPQARRELAFLSRPNVSVSPPLQHAITMPGVTGHVHHAPSDKFTCLRESKGHGGM